MNSPSPALPLTFAERSGERAVRLVRAAVRIAVIDRRESPPRWLFIAHPQKGLELPGGAVDPGEGASAAARRELTEEAGWLLPLEHPVHLVGTVPIQDGNGGHWLDLVYYSFIDEGFAQTQGDSTPRVPEFPLAWLTQAEVNERLSHNARSVVGCVSLALGDV